jgi:hypothetical protein
MVGAAACAAMLVLGCSWDYPVWPKNKKSDTALFRFLIAQHNGAGYIDRNGKVVIQPTLDQFWNNAGDDFFDGLAKIRVNQELWFIDATGRRVFRAHGYGRFSEGFASQTKDGKSGYVNRRGEFVVPPTFDSADEFSEGLAVVGMNRIYGYIGKDGSVAIPLNFSAAMAFSDGAARVIEQGNCLYVGYGPCAGLNPMVLPYDPQRKQTSDPPRCRYSYIDKTGRRLFENTYQDAKDFAEGLAPVGDGKYWGYVDRKGSVAIPLRYDGAEPFSEGLARVRLRGKWGYIDKTGQFAIPATFDSALDFSEGVAVVGDGPDRSWFVDKQGRQAIPGFFTSASSFALGLAHVRVGHDYYSAKWSYIDRTGHAVFTYSDRSNSGRGRK